VVIEEPVRYPGGWVVARSIAKELDAALSLFSGYGEETSRPPEVVSAMRAVPHDWRSQWSDLLGAPRRWIGVLMEMAILAGVLLEEDYSRATLAMRQLTLEGALCAVESALRSYGLEPDTDGSLEERFVRTAARLVPAINRNVDLTPVSEEVTIREATYEVRRVLPLLSGGALHARFWLWLDRFYFEFYRPWREGRLQSMEAEEARAIAALGAREGRCPPDTTWLPRENVLAFRPEMAQAVSAGRARVFFWTQPFGLFDYWSLAPGMVITVYGQPEQSVAEYLRETAEPLAERAKALSDGTRLMLLRIIRNLAMDNTQMADLLGIARPTVSVHAKILREAGLINTRQEGRASAHTLNARAVRQLFREIEQFLQLPEEGEE